ncbi:hypothetical protein Q7C36_000858 [Tachysurus vachellii]|uniref:G-protein coupled receptors family 3 profile domain-containing protein n=1 Tax=Tachysurus vachellii TaxID=175792 RepID=A0AA88NWV4_TACVA|nr:hypothetical protein Q7C36_000858 [Tachysurus vachellii]
MKLTFPDKLLVLLLLSSLLSAQLSSNFDPRMSSIKEPTPSTSNLNSTEVEELAGSTQPPSVSTNPQVAVEEEQAWYEPENYLYTGDASLLSSSRCQNSFQLTAQPGAIPQDLKDLLYQPTVSLTNTVNFLNLIFQASELRETSVREDIEWYHALSRSLLVGESPGLVRNALLSFDADPTAPHPQLVLWASKGSSQDIYLQDLTLTWEKLHLLPHGLNQSWFTLLKSNTPYFPSLSKQVLLNDLSTLDTPKWAHGGTYVTNSSGLQWGEAPFLECKEERYLPGWLLTLSMPFHGLKPDLSPEFRGVIRVDVNIQDFDVNQCSTGDFWFADTHQCNRTSMECQPIPRQGFRLGQYCCRCKEGYYSLPAVTEDQLDDSSSSSHGCYPVIPVCVPCWPGCKQCQDGSPCWVQEDWHLRAVLLTVHSFFMALVLISMLRVYQCQRTRPIRASGLLLLEIILFGSLLLYFPVLIIYFKPSTFRCILLRWVRLLGFAIVYGTVTLKMYRILNAFLSCTAQRVPYMSSTSVLKMLGVMVLTVKWFLCAWTVGVLQNQDRNIPQLITLTTADGQSFKVCDLDRWDYMMAIAELLFLCWGSSLSSAVKSVPSAFHEPRYMGIAIHNELLFSTVFHLLRFVKPSLHPDWMLLLFFFHIHFTIGVTLGLLFFPKLIKEDIASEMYEDEVELPRSCLHLNNSFTSACWSDHNLDPDDIRGELKKLYAQLEVHKTKKMENKNPHLQKKRSSRLLLGRSLIRRIAEIPESTSRQGSRKNKDTSGAGGQQKRSASCLATSESTHVIIRNETAKLPSPETQRCVALKDSSLINPSLNICMTKRASETESIDTAPLFCKSLSAQNLAVDNNFLHPLPTRVQKSFSFTEKHRDHYPLSPTKNTVNASDVFKTSLKDKLFDKAEIKEQPTDSNMPNQKQVSEHETLTPKVTSPPALLYVCPWEFASSLPSSSSPVSKVESGLDSDVESPRPKPPISSSAPGSPYSFAKPMAHCGFSFHSTTQTVLLARSVVAKKRNSKYSNKNKLGKEEVSSQQTRSMTLSNAIKSVKNTPQTPIRSRTCGDSKPRLVKQTAISESPDRNSICNAPQHTHQWEFKDMMCKNITHSQNCSKHSLCPASSIERTKVSWHQDRAFLSAPRSTVCRWDVPKPTYRQSSIADICHWEVKQQDLLQPKDLYADDGSNCESDSKQMQITTGDKDICTWASLGKTSRTSCSNSKSEIGTKQHQSHTEAEGFLYNAKQDSAKSVSEAAQPTERVIYVHAHPDTKMQSLEKQEVLRTDICPWETTDTHRNPETMCVDVYPWKFNATLEKCSETLRGSDSKSLTMPSPQRLLRKQLISPVAMKKFPWDFPEGFSCQWKSEKFPKTDAEKPRADVKKTKAMPYPLTKQLISCPWDLPEAPPMEKEVHLLELEEASQQPRQGEDNMVLPSQVSTTNKTDSCSQEGEASKRSKGITIKKEVDASVLKKESVHAKICLWENIKLDSEQPEKSTQKQITPHVNVDPMHTGEPGNQIQNNQTSYSDICPWKTEPAQSQNDLQAHICPWELEVSGTSTMQESVHRDVSTLVNDSEGPAIRKNSISEKMDEDTSAHTAQGARVNRPLTRCDALCPWEIKAGSQASITLYDNNSDIFTWEEPIAEEGSDAESAAEAFIFPPDV